MRTYRWGRANTLAATLMISVALGGCVAAPGESHESVADLQPTYAPLPHDAEFAEAGRELCLPELGVDPNLPLVVQDRREAESAWMMFADRAVVATCQVERAADGIRLLSWVLSDRWTSEGARGSGGLTIHQGLAADATTWNSAQGVVPSGASVVRVVVDGSAVDAVIGQDLYSVTWPGGKVPTVLAALSADGIEIARIGAAELANVYDRPCDPTISLGTCPSP